MFRELGALGAFLPGPPADLSAGAVRGWPVHAGPICPRCGAFAPDGPDPPPSGPCDACRVPPPFDFARSLFRYEGRVADGIRAAKYGGHPGAADAVASRLHGAIREAWAGLLPGGCRPSIVPVPIRPGKYFSRGFNFPGLAGAALSRLAGWPFEPRLLLRVRGGIPQAGLPLAAREANVRGAFRAAPGCAERPALLVVDDVYTSGATAAACARALKTAGAGTIVVITAARAVP